MTMEAATALMQARAEVAEELRQLRAQRDWLVEWLAESVLCPFPCPVDVVHISGCDNETARDCWQRAAANATGGEADADTQ